MKHISMHHLHRSFGRYLPKRIEDVVLKALDKQPHRLLQYLRNDVRDLRKYRKKPYPKH